MLPGLAPASSAMSRIDTALKPFVENNSSAALRMASRILGFRVMAFAFRSRLLYVCTKYQAQSTNIWTGRDDKGEPPDAPDHRCVSDRRRRTGLARRQPWHRDRSGTAPNTGAIRR